MNYWGFFFLGGEPSLQETKQINNTQIPERKWQSWYLNPKTWSFKLILGYDIVLLTNTK